MSFVSPMKKSIITSAKPIDAGALHGPHRDRAAADLLDQAQKMWPPSSGRNGKQVDEREREADHGEHAERLAGVELEACRVTS